MTSEELHNAITMEARAIVEEIRERARDYQEDGASREDALEEAANCVLCYNYNQAILLASGALEHHLGIDDLADEGEKMDLWGQIEDAIRK